MTDPRYWITDIDTSHYLYQWIPDWYGVVDEVKGGIIAYFSEEAQANSFIQSLPQSMGHTPSDYTP